MAALPNVFEVPVQLLLSRLQNAYVLNGGVDVEVYLVEVVVNIIV